MLVLHELLLFEFKRIISAVVMVSHTLLREAVTSLIDNHKVPVSASGLSAMCNGLPLLDVINPSFI